MNDTAKFGRKYSQIIDLINKGRTYEEITQELSCSNGTISKAKKWYANSLSRLNLGSFAFNSLAVFDKDNELVLTIGFNKIEKDRVKKMDVIRFSKDGRNTAVLYASKFGIESYKKFLEFYTLVDSNVFPI